MKNIKIVFGIILFLLLIILGNNVNADGYVDINMNSVLKKEITVGEEKTIGLLVDIDDGYLETASWTNSDDDVVYLNYNNSTITNIIGQEAGTAEITLTYTYKKYEEDGSYIIDQEKKTIKIVVKNPDCSTMTFEEINKECNDNTDLIRSDQMLVVVRQKNNEGSYRTHFQKIFKWDDIDDDPQEEYQIGSDYEFAYEDEIELIFYLECSNLNNDTNNENCEIIDFEGTASLKDWEFDTDRK